MPRSTRTTALALVTCLSTISLAACGGDWTSSSSSTSTATSTVAASGAASSAGPVEGTGAVGASAQATAAASLAGYKTVTGKGYALQVPSSWTKVSTQRADFAYASNTAHGNFRENVNALAVSEQVSGEDDVLAQAKQELASAGVKDITDEGFVTVAGQESPVISSVISKSGLSYRALQTFVPRNGGGVVVTVSDATSIPLATQKQDSEKILSTFT